MLPRFFSHTTRTQACRNSARSRFLQSSPAGLRRDNRARTRAFPRKPHERANVTERSYQEESTLWTGDRRASLSDLEEGLQRLLSEDVLVVTRQLEMLNVFAGFEQANKYSICNIHGEPLGFIAEESPSVLSTASRQLFRTHRPLNAVIMDQGGTPVLWLRRPFSLVASRMFVQRMKNRRDYSTDNEPSLDTFAEVQQLWHLWRRRYDLFLKDPPKKVLTLADEPQLTPQAEVTEDEYVQIAKIDQGLWAWNFFLQDEAGKSIALVSKQYRGIGREIFTDTSQYFVHFRLPQNYAVTLEGQTTSTKDAAARQLSLEEKALILAAAVNIDFDYFSRHSQGSGWGLPLLLFAGAE